MNIIVNSVWYRDSVPDLAGGGPGAHTLVGGLSKFGMTTDLTECYFDQVPCAARTPHTVRSKQQTMLDS